MEHVVQRQIEGLELRLDQLIKLQKRLEDALQNSSLSEASRNNCREALPACTGEIQSLREKLGSLRLHAAGTFDPPPGLSPG